MASCNMGHLKLLLIEGQTSHHYNSIASTFQLAGNISMQVYKLNNLQSLLIKANSYRQALKETMHSPSFLTDPVSRQLQI